MQMMNKTTDDPYRIQHRFWLDGNRNDESDLVEYIAYLKEKRRFASTIRDALRLIQDLRQGSVRVLLNLFPWIWDQIESEVRASMVQSHQSDLRPTLQEHLERMEKLLAERTSGNGQAHVLPVAPRALTTGDNADLDIEIKVESDPEAGKRATRNFMRSLVALQTSYQNPKVGSIGNGSTKRKDIQKHSKKEEIDVIQAPTGNAKRMEVPILDVPDFEDDEDDSGELMVVKGAGND